MNNTGCFFNWVSPKYISHSPPSPPRKNTFIASTLFPFEVWESNSQSKYFNLFWSCGEPFWDSNVFFFKSVTSRPTLSKFRGTQLKKTPKRAAGRRQRGLLNPKFWWHNMCCDGPLLSSVLQQTSSIMALLVHLNMPLFGLSGCNISQKIEVI